MKIKVLGNGSASPSLERSPSSVIVEHKNKYYLIDCGEGTQYKLLEFHINFNKLTHILITHLHGDHYAGVFSLISTLNSWGREKELTIVAPPGLKEILSLQFQYQNTTLHFELIIIETNTDKYYKIFENKDIALMAFPLSHRIPTTGFLIKETNQENKIIKDKLPSNIKIADIQTLKKGHDVWDTNGQLLYKNSDYTTPAPLPKTFAYCSDTIFDENIIQYINHVDLLYHEATFTNEHSSRATATYHSTAQQAAIIAKKAKVNQLIIGHFSARYNNIEPFLDEAKQEFENTILSVKGLEIVI